MKEKIIFKIRNPSIDGHVVKGDDGRYLHNVMFWLGYGSVCPTLWTTNGNIAYTAKLVADYIAKGYVVSESILSADTIFTDVEALKTELIFAYRQFVSECNSHATVVD
jgi:hypothetical protein